MSNDASPLPFWSSWRADLRAHVALEERPRAGSGWAWKWFRLGLRIALASPGFRATGLYRLSHSARLGGGWPGRVLAAFLHWIGRHWYGCDIAPTARLSGGLILPHPLGIVIGPKVEVGADSYIFHHVTLGGSPGREGTPKIGPNARIYPGAVAAGPIRLGDSVRIGANAVVTRDVPNGAIIRAGSNPPHAPASVGPEEMID